MEKLTNLYATLMFGLLELKTSHIFEKHRIDSKPRWIELEYPEDTTISWL